MSRSLDHIPAAQNGISERFLVGLALFFGFASWGIVLAYHNIADGDLWAKLAFGAWVMEHGWFPRHDVFAFTPVLPQYVDHEWCAGVILFAVMKLLGPAALLLLKILLAFSTLAVALNAGRKQGTPWPWLILLAVPAAMCILPGYVVVVRSHAFTYLFFALTLGILERIQQGQKWPGWALAGVMAAWVNIHGGFVAGLGVVGVYASFSLGKEGHRPTMLMVGAGCLLATLATPYGPTFWSYLVPALLHPRPSISEWQPMPLWGWDAFIGFRILVPLTLGVLALGWKGTKSKPWPGLLLTVLTAYLALRSRRHAPFFGICALAFVSPFLPAAVAALGCWLPVTRHRLCRPAFAVAISMGLLALVVGQQLLPHCMCRVLAPVGQYPVREVDILVLARAEGNVAAPFEWGSYVSWRLYPRIKVSCDGRYEAAYPESTFQMNRAFFARTGFEWDKLIREQQVDYIILDLQNAGLRPEDLSTRGYKLIWQVPGVSALWASASHSSTLESVANNLPETTMEPLDAQIPQAWPRGNDPLLIRVSSTSTDSP